MGNQKFASDDDAGDLLAGILNETALEAEAEQARLEADLKAREEDERLKKEIEDRRKKEEAEARLEAEQNRLKEVEKRRTQKLEAIRIEDLKESGQWVPPEEPEEEPEPAHQAPPEAAMRPPQPAAQSSSQPVITEAAPPAKSNTGLIATLALLVVAIVGAAVIAFMVLPDSYEVDTTTYTKATFSPAQKEASLVELGFAPIPERQEAAPTRTTARPSRGRTTPRQPAAERPAAQTPRPSPGLSLDLDTDPFSGGL